jgi:hypothetical protein
MSPLAWNQKDRGSSLLGRDTENVKLKENYRHCQANRRKKKPFSLVLWMKYKDTGA